MTNTDSKYPESDRYATVVEQASVIGEFLEWLEGRGVSLVRYGDAEFVPTPFHYNGEKLTAEFFGIDLDKVEAERRAALDELRQAQAVGLRRIREREARDAEDACSGSPSSPDSPS